jgi:hypothetical protein
MTTNSKIFSTSYGCKAPDGQHIYGDNGRCLMCWRMRDETNQASRVLVILVSAEGSECERVEQLAEILEAQLRGVIKAVALFENRNRDLDAPSKPVEMEVYAS